VFVETGVDGGATVAAYAAELPGCATFAETDAAAVAAMPGRVREFIAWLRDHGETAPAVAGDNWYEVERAAAGDGGSRRATFTLDELPPSEAEWERWLGWLELAREDVAESIDEAGPEAATADGSLVALAAQDEAFAAELGAPAHSPSDDPIDRLYVARDALTDALTTGGPSGPNVRRILRLAIADDLRLAARLRGDIG
jgi:hypothetical protein